MDSVQSNWGDLGGAIAVQAGSLSSTTNQFSFNTATQRGGAVYLDNSAASFTGQFLFTMTASQAMSVQVTRSHRTARKPEADSGPHSAPSLRVMYNGLAMWRVPAVEVWAEQCLLRTALAPSRPTRSDGTLRSRRPNALLRSSTVEALLGVKALPLWLS